MSCDIYNTKTYNAHRKSFVKLVDVWAYFLHSVVVG